MHRRSSAGVRQRLGELAADAPTANAHVREQQDDEDGYEDYPDDHATQFRLGPSIPA